VAGCQDAGRIAGPTLAPALQAASATAPTAGDVVLDEYIITFADSVRDTPALARQLAEAGRGSCTSPTRGTAGLRSASPAAAVEALRRNPRVAAIEPDQRVKASEVQSTPGSWGLDRIDQRTGTNGVYSFASAGAGVNVYVLDTGIRTTHRDFGGRASGAYTAISDGNGTNDCGSGHGTHAAATIAGDRYGVAKAARVYSVRVLDCTRWGANSGIIAGIDWVTANRVLPAVANMSMSGNTSLAMNTAVQNSIRAGVVYAVAAGNAAANACNYSPGNVTEALTVGAIWNGDAMSGFSNFGSCVDLFAPGEAIRSASIVDDTSSVIKGGTSMATPHVAGVAALYLAANPLATPAQVAAAIVGGATPDVLTNVPIGTANRLLYSLVTGSSVIAPAPPSGPDPIDTPPLASFTGGCAKGRCSFDAATSTDDKGIVSYSWSFGDGRPPVEGGALVRTQYTFTSPGTYTITLTIVDSAGQRGRNRRRSRSAASDAR
jgi:subtilisin family serine protease